MCRCSSRSRRGSMRASRSGGSASQRSAPPDRRDRRISQARALVRASSQAARTRFPGSGSAGSWRGSRGERATGPARAGRSASRQARTKRSDSSRGSPAGPGAHRGRHGLRPAAWFEYFDQGLGGSPLRRAAALVVGAGSAIPSARAGSSDRRLPSAVTMLVMDIQRHRIEHRSSASSRVRAPAPREFTRRVKGDVVGDEDTSRSSGSGRSRVASPDRSNRGERGRCQR